MKKIVFLLLFLVPLVLQAQTKNPKYMDNLKLLLEKEGITPCKVFFYPKGYYSRSKIGMRNTLVFELGLNDLQAKGIIELWIEEKKIIPTKTPDNHYIINKKINGNDCN